MSRPHKHEHVAAVLCLVQAAGAVGILTDDIPGMTVSARSNAVERLVAQADIFKGKRGHRTMRLFASAAWAEAFGAHQAVLLTAARRSTAPWGKDEAAKYPHGPNGEPLYKFTSTPFPERPAHAPIRTGNYSPC